MATSFCSVCGAVLRGGVCPNGHPQRAARRAGSRRQRRWPWVVALLVLVAAGAAYGGLRWYPERAAGDLMRPSSEDYASALEAYRAAVAAAPRESSDPHTVVQAAEDFGGPVEGARIALAKAQLSLEDREPPSIPVVLEQPPLADAIELRNRMLRLYPVALEATADLENLTGYVTELSRTLPQLQNVESTLRQAGPADVGDAVAVARPVAGQLAADLDAIAPPDQLGSVHAALQAIAAQMGSNLEEAGRAGGQASEPVLLALVEDVIRDIREFRQTFAAAPGTALQSGLGERLDQVDRMAERITAGLADLRDQGVTGITVPDSE